MSGKVEYLDPEIASEGEKVGFASSEVITDPNVEGYQAPMKPPAIPDYSGITSLQKYFAKKPFQAFPCWLYWHGTGHKEPVYVPNAKAAEKYSVANVKSTAAQRSNGFGEYHWVYDENNNWRPYQREGDTQFNPRKPGSGKNVTSGDAAQHSPSSTASVQTMASAVGAAVAAEMARGQQSPQAIAEIVSQSVAAAIRAMGIVPPATMEQELAVERLQEHEKDVLHDLDVDARRHLKAEAEQKGIKVDGRWSVQKLQDMIKAAS